MTLRVLIVDDDFRVAEIHARYASSTPGISVCGTVHSAADALTHVERDMPDLVLLDNYLPDLPGVKLARRLPCEIFMVTADRSTATVRAAMTAGVINYIVKPFAGTVLTARLNAWARYRQALEDVHDELDQSAIDRAVALLHQADRLSTAKGRSPVTERLVANLLQESIEPQTAADAASALGISRTTAQRYLASLAESGRATVIMRYGATGRPEHLYAWDGA